MNESNFLASATDQMPQIQQDINISLVSIYQSILVRQTPLIKLSLNSFSFMQSNNFRNQKFDLILFDEDDTEGFSCYAKAVFNLDWNSNCKFSDKTKVFTNRD